MCKEVIINYILTLRKLSFREIKNLSKFTQGTKKPSQD